MKPCNSIPWYCLGLEEFCGRELKKKGKKRTTTHLVRRIAGAQCVPGLSKSILSRMHKYSTRNPNTITLATTDWPITQRTRVQKGTARERKKGVSRQKMYAPMPGDGIADDAPSIGAWSGRNRRSQSSSVRNTFRPVPTIKWKSFRKNSIQHLADGAMCSCFTAELAGCKVVIKKPSPTSHEVCYISPCVSLYCTGCASIVDAVLVAVVAVTVAAAVSTAELAEKLLTMRRGILCSTQNGAIGTTAKSSNITA